jgi:hypothetical protein
VVGLHAAEPSEVACGAWSEVACTVLQCGHCVLVLQAQGRQLVGEDGWQRAGARGEAMDLERVGCITDGAVQRSDDAPRVSRADGLVLSRGDHDAAPGVLERGVIEVLTHAVLVRPQRAVRRQPRSCSSRRSTRTGSVPTFSTRRCQNQAGA